MKFFVIRHKPTGKLMRSNAHRRSTAFTRWEPTLCTAKEPRLFATERAAKNALTAWLQGVWEIQIEHESQGWEHGPGYDYQSTPAPAGGGMHPRIRADMEVVPVELTGL